MPAVIDTRRPRVLRCNPDCLSLIPHHLDDNVHATKFIESNHEHAQPHRCLREALRNQKHRKRKSKFYKIASDMQAIISMENFCDVAKEVKVRLSHHVTCFPVTKIINSDVVVRENEPHDVVNNPHLGLDLHQSALNRLPKSPAKSSQCSCLSGIKRGSHSDPEERRHKLDREWFVGQSERSFNKYRFKNNSNKIQRWDNRAINNSKRQSYLQFVLLFLLFAFGHSNVTRSSVPGVVTFGTMFCAPTWAAPINSLETANRSERSTNLSYLSGTSRWIRMFVRNRYLQILPDGTVNGTDDDESIYTILQRITVATAQLQIKASATCLYLCMDSCGLLYGSSNVTEHCIFKENMLKNHYNYYSSLSESGPHKSLLIALDRFGQSRKLKVHNNNFGKRINYARTLTVMASPKQMAALRTYTEGILQNQKKIRHVRNARHDFSLQQKFCSTLPKLNENIRENLKCRKQAKRKKNKRTPSVCKGSEQRDGGNSCGPWSGSSDVLSDNRESSLSSTRSCEDRASDVLCKKQLRNASSKKKKSRIKVSKGDEKSQPRRKGIKQEVIKKLMAADALKDSKKLAVIIKQQKKPVQKRTSSDVKKKLTEKTIRTSSIPPWENSRATLRTRHTVPTSPSTWDNSQIRISTTYPKNAVTTAAKPGIINTFQIPFKVNPEFNSSLLSSAFEVSSDSVSSAMSSDSSIEDSEEGIYSDDIESTSSIDYVTLMTTMDTTPPERTEVYTKATTQSTFDTLDVKFNQFFNSTNHTTTIEGDVLH